MGSRTRLHAGALAAIVASCVAVAGGIVRGAASTTTLQTTTLQSPKGAPVCPGNPLAGVHDPERLKVLNPCATFTGTVVRAPRLNPSDGDVYFVAKPDPGYEQMLDARNLEEGGIHLEIVPRDQPGCVPGAPIKGDTNNLGTCSGADVLFPPLGAHVRVYGAWVLDTWNNWNEIHPVWRVVIIRPSGPAPAEQHTFRADLVRRGGNRGPRRLHAQFVLTGRKFCWRFGHVSGTAPRRAALTPRVGSVKRFVVIPLGDRFARAGCSTLSATRLSSLTASPMNYEASVFPRRGTAGVLRGPLVPTSD